MVFLPHTPLPGGMLTHNGNYGDRSGGGTKSMIGGLQTSREPQFAQQSDQGRKHPSGFTLGFDQKGSGNLTLWDLVLRLQDIFVRALSAISNVEFWL